MKVYFAGSIRAGRNDADLYQKIIRILQDYGDVLTEHVGDQTLTAFGEDGPDDETIYIRDMGWLLEADVVVAEVTTPSLGVGFEIGFACENNKPVLCLYRHQKTKRLSAMIAGNPKILVKEYQNLEEINQIIKEFLNDLGY